MQDECTVVGFETVCRIFCKLLHPGYKSILIKLSDFKLM